MWLYYICNQKDYKLQSNSGAFMQYPNPPLTFSIIPNPRFSSGVILVVTQKYDDGDIVEVDRFPCHNRATAEFTKRQIIAANK
jgi:hypothetical protein